MGTFLTISKTVITGLTGIGIGNIFSNLVRSVTPQNVNMFNKISINVASLVLAGMITKDATKYINEEIDSLFNHRETVG